MDHVPTNNQTNLLNLLSDPKDVVYDCIFPLLDHADILRLRRVCQPIKTFADQYIRNHYQHHFRLINESNYTICYFLQADIPSSSIRIENSSVKFFDDPDIPEFLRLYGNKITHVHAHLFYYCVSLPELQFYSNLPNLQYLEFDFIDARKVPNEDDLSLQIERYPFPQNFKNMKTLKLNEIWISDIDNLDGKWDLIKFSNKLEYLKFHPLFKHIPQNKTIHRNNSFDFVITYIEYRQRNFPNAPNLQFFDLQHHGNFSDFRKFATLVKLCYQHNIKLLNVPSELVDRNSGILRTYSKAFTRPLVSLRNVMGFMMLVELDNLESLTIESSKLTSFRRFWPEVREEDEGENNLFCVGLDIVGGGGGEMIPFGRPPQWEKLKRLDLTIDSKMIREIDAEGNKVNPVGVEKLFKVLFPSGQRSEKVEELVIRFGYVPVRAATEACPFITKLTLTDWQGSNDGLSMFWENLLLLEDVTLEKCKELGDKAFIGRWKRDDVIYWQLRELDDRRLGRRENEDQPVFLGLKKLRKLSLKNLELMPRITDRTFEKIFRHLKIKEFLLTSERPINTVTLAGIESLLTGNFIESVERFPFEGWSLMGVSNGALSELKFSFRASYMI